jgi:hypothetical protein
VSVQQKIFLAEIGLAARDRSDNPLSLADSGMKPLQRMGRTISWIQKYNFLRVLNGLAQNMLSI